MSPQPEPTVARRSLRARSAGGKGASRQWEVGSGEGAGLRAALALGLLALPPLIPALIALARRFDGLYGQDPYAYYAYAVGPLRAALLRPAPPPEFYWPPGYPILVALASFALGARPLAGQAISLLAAALVPVGTALVAREVWVASRPASGATGQPPPAAVPLGAGLLLAGCGQLWQSGVVVMSDTAGLAAGTWGVWALLRYGRGRHGGWLALAATLLAGAILIRWAYALVALPCLAYALWLLVRAAPAGRGRSVAHALGAAALAGAIVGPLLVAALPPRDQTMPRTVAAPPSRPAPFAADLAVYRWQPLNALRREFATADGRLRYPLPNGLYYATLLARPFYFTPLLAWLALPGLWVALRRPTAPTLLIVGWAAVVPGFHAGAAWQNVRFGLAYAPPVAILIALGLAALWGRGGRPARAVTCGALALGLLWMGVAGVRLLDGFIARQEGDRAVARAIVAPPDARLLAFGLTLTLRYATPYPTYELSEFDPRGLDALLADGRATFVVVDVANLEGQWRGRAPEVNYRWLRERWGLTVVGVHGGYTVFRVAGGGGPPTQVSAGGLQPHSPLQRTDEGMTLATRYSLLVARPARAAR